ncbi:hypothetical protein [Idiomarina xiamenensis]|uniref:Uncharacterized protein n=1 Tax=Idiomarina xiamenensis 10-D-4 TaxID=740709 RepID=K2KIH0_9GAMM|nr:hypothetical protein [Idiomarina xiamenensis]EKE87658.1 hypothetical protein A10D4_01150 [Idiomarina xiamenensis 10-D-4]
MRQNRLSSTEFNRTFSIPMRDISDSAEKIVDIWPYLTQVLADEYAEVDTGAWDTEYVYENPQQTHQHVLINAGMENVYLVVVIDIDNRCIFGRHLLNLNQLYNLSH